MDVSNPFFGWLLRSSLQACILVSLIYLIKVIVKDKLPIRWHHSLWILLLVRMAIPWGIGFPTDTLDVVPNSLERSAIGFVSQDLTWFDFDLPTVPAGELTSNSDSEELAVAATDSKPAPSIAKVKSEHVVVAKKTRVIDALVVIWLLGTLLFLGAVFLASLRLSLLVRKESYVNDEKISSLVSSLSTEMDIKTPPKIVLTDHLTTPALLGFIKPKLLLPRELAGSLNEEELKHIFIHELAHLKRHDVFVGWVMIALQAVHWFNPLVWIGFKRMRSDRELATDGLALSILKPNETEHYGKTIIRLLERFSSPNRLPSLAGVLEEKREAKRRILMISKYRQNSNKWSPAAVVLLLMVAIVSIPQGALSDSIEDAVEAQAEYEETRAKYEEAMVLFKEFNAIEFPFPVYKDPIPEEQLQWFIEQQGEKYPKVLEYKKYRELLVENGEMSRSAADEEQSKEDRNIQFQYWAKHVLAPIMEQKSEALEKANYPMREVVEYHVPEWEILATIRAAQMQMAMVEFLDQAPLPPALVGDSKLEGIYRSAMDEKKIPFLEATIEIYKHCVGVDSPSNSKSAICKKQLPIAKKKLKELKRNTIPKQHDK